MEAQPRIIDLIPRKPLTLVLCFLAGVLAIAGLELLYAWMPRFAASTTDGRIAAFDLDGEGSLAAWFSSLLLLANGLVCLLIWSLRRHRLDDYHGRYRIWFWAAGVWILMSIDEAGSLHEGFKELLSHATGQRLFGDGSLWWVMAYLVLLGGLGIRLLVEMRPCRTSTAFFLLAGCLWGASVAWQLELVMPRSGARGIMFEEGGEMLGDLVLLLGFAVHARYVLMDVQGLIPQSKRKKARQRKIATAEAAEASRPGADDAPSNPTPAKRPAAAVAASTIASDAQNRASGKPSAAQATQRIDLPENPLQTHKQSKAHRRAQRRLAREREE